jgi:hypothetical protein
MKLPDRVYSARRGTSPAPVTRKRSNGPPNMKSLVLYSSRPTPPSQGQLQRSLYRPLSPANLRCPRPSKAASKHSLLYFLLAKRLQYLRPSLSRHPPRLYHHQLWRSMYPLRSLLPKMRTLHGTLSLSPWRTSMPWIHTSWMVL